MGALAIWSYGPTGDADRLDCRFTDNVGDPAGTPEDIENGGNEKHRCHQTVNVTHMIPKA